jgi:hypothetical protein
MLKIILRAVISLFIIGCLIGIFHKYDLFLCVFLSIYLVYKFYREIKIHSINTKVVLLFFGTLLSGFLGVLAELWGIENGYWLYHGLSDNRQFPYWLPLAWGLTFMFFYQIEESILKKGFIKSFKIKFLMVLLLSATLPTWGEIITIYLGVWTYTWPLQFFKVPLLAIFLLVAFHTSIFLFFTFICKRFNIYNLVFNNIKNKHI